jgi:hypothetical protein
LYEELVCWKKKAVKGGSKAAQGRLAANEVRTFFSG